MAFLSNIDPEDISDLLVKHMHLGWAIDLEFAELLDTAQLNYTYEITQEYESCATP